MVPPYIKYVGKKTVTLCIMLLIAVYLTVIIANLGGYIDNVLKSQIVTSVHQMFARNQEFQKLSPEEQKAIINALIEQQFKAYGLDKPFFPYRSFIYFKKALTFSLGRALVLRSAGGSSSIRAIILERLPWTMLLFTTGTLISAFLGIYIGLHMGRKALSVFDRGMSVFAVVTTSIPPWFFGILAILIFSYRLGWFPSGGWVEQFVGVPWHKLVVDILWHLALPLGCWVFSNFGYWAYTTRNLVIHIMHEDYVTVARAKGVPEDLILRRYVLKPAAPPIVTMVSLAVIASWTGAIITETVFKWYGLGYLYWQAIMTLDAPVIIGLTVIYAYLLVATVIMLELLYGYLDPRIRVGG